MLTAKHILIIDDDPDDREFMNLAFKSINDSVNCFFAANGNEALELLESDQSFVPDYIFLDLNMPLMDGNQCLKRLKQVERLRNIPVIICSTTRSVREKKAALDLGAADFISKPTLIRDWIAQLRKVFITFGEQGYR